MIERIRKLGLRAGLTLALASMIGCATNGNNDPYYNCNALNYEQIETGGGGDNALGFYILGGALKMLAPGASTLQAARAADIGGDMAIGHGHAVSGRDNTEQTTVRERRWAFVTKANAGYSTACLAIKDEDGSGSISPNELKMASGAYNLSELERIGINEIIFETAVYGRVGTTLEFYIFREGVQTSMHGVQGIRVDREGFLPNLGIPIWTLRDKGALGNCFVEWRIKPAGSTAPVATQVIDRYNITLCP